MSLEQRRAGSRLKSGLVILLSILVIVFAGSNVVGPAPAHSQSSLSSVYVNPVQSCCVNKTDANPTVKVNVMMNLTVGDTMNGYDIRLNYTHWFTPLGSPPGVLKAVTLDPSSNYFAANNYQSTIQASCIDDVAIPTEGSSGFCATDDLPGGQVHLAETILGATISGPVNAALLFTVTFTVNGTGTSIFYLDRANLGNPTGDNGPHFVKVVTGAGIFGNEPLVAFFDYTPNGGAPAVITTHGLTLDASKSFRSTSNGPAPLTSPSYKWSFGDGTPNATGAIVPHTYRSPGNYTVSLTVNDTGPGGGFTQRVIPVVPPWGGIYVTVFNQNGGNIGSIVVAQVYNNTIPPILTGNETLSAGGIAQFHNLKPGIYNLKFYGSGIKDGSKSNIVVSEGWTERVTVFLTEIAPPGPNDLPLYIFGGLILGGVVAAGVGLFYRQRRMASARAKKPEKERRKYGRR